MIYGNILIVDKKQTIEMTECVQIIAIFSKSHSHKCTIIIFSNAKVTRNKLSGQLPIGHTSQLFRLVMKLKIWKKCIFHNKTVIFIVQKNMWGCCVLLGNREK